jgi:hypothetical protein
MFDELHMNPPPGERLCSLESSAKRLCRPWFAFDEEYYAAIPLAAGDKAALTGFAP